MAAEALSTAGIEVDLYDAMPSPGRKFLLAGIGGLNLTHAEDPAQFCARFGDAQAWLQPMLDRFPPQAVRDWAQGLGIETFVGSSGRIFPLGMKAAPLLRRWLQRLRSAGVQLHTRHRWLGWTADGSLRLASAHSELTLRPSATVLALGGASWPQLGSDGSWVPLLAAAGVAIQPLQAANCGFDVAWSAHLRERFAGAPLKSVCLDVIDAHGRVHRQRGELVISAHGVEGSLVYACSRILREQLAAGGRAGFTLDLLPDHSALRVAEAVAHPRGARSLSSHLQSRLGLTGIKVALLFEVLGKTRILQTDLLARTIKALPISVQAARPLAEAISSAGGVGREAVDAQLMLRAWPGVFVAGEMLDWEAPTGGYLLTASLASGLAAGLGARAWLER
ncbi:MAG: TIGR03862 family flavoprotein [Pseudomonadota bacterium]|nr:TIGR03862 family flavoprotein [Pseudomonadota bacterium]